MQCMILFPGHDGRLPSPEEMRSAGFVLSAALGRGRAEPPGAGPAMAAEEPGPYGAPSGESQAEPEAATG